MSLRIVLGVIAGAALCLALQHLTSKLSAQGRPARATAIGSSVQLEEVYVGDNCVIVAKSVSNYDIAMVPCK